MAPKRKWLRGKKAIQIKVEDNVPSSEATVIHVRNALVKSAKETQDGQLMRARAAQRYLRRVLSWFYSPFAAMDTSSGLTQHLTSAL
jgi:hypothetical protein